MYLAVRDVLHQLSVLVSELLLDDTTRVEAQHQPSSSTNIAIIHVYNCNCNCNCNRG